MCDLSSNMVTPEAAVFIYDNTPGSEWMGSIVINDIWQVAVLQLVFTACLLNDVNYVPWHWNLLINVNN